MFYSCLHVDRLSFLTSSFFVYFLSRYSFETFESYRKLIRIVIHHVFPVIEHIVFHFIWHYTIIVFGIGFYLDLSTWKNVIFTEPQSRGIYAFKGPWTKGRQHLNGYEIIIFYHSVVKSLNTRHMRAMSYPLSDKTMSNTAVVL